MKRRGIIPILFTLSLLLGFTMWQPERGVQAVTPLLPPAVQAVTNTNDSGAGSLRQAIADAVSGDMITFNLTGCPCTITLTSGELVINKNLTINGPGASQLTISGNNASRVFFINPGAPGATTGPPATSLTVSISNLTIANGKAKGGDGAVHSYGGGGGGAAGMGGAIFVNNGALTVSEVNFNGNQAQGGNGGFIGGGLSYGGRGGGGISGNGGGGFTAGGGGGGGGNLGGNGGGGGAEGSGSGQAGQTGGNGGEGAGGGGGGLGEDGFFGNVGGNGGPGGAGGFGGGGGAGGNGGFGTTLGGAGASGGFGGGGGGGGGGRNFGAGGLGGNSSQFGGKGGNGRNFGSDTGGSGGGGAGLGGAIFLRAGSLNLTNSNFTNNSATGGAGNQNGQGKGGALFINTGTTANSSGDTFGGNTASDQTCSANDNIDVYGSVSGYTYVNRATQLAFGQQPTTTPPNTALTPAVTVRLLDPCGSLFSASSAAVTIALGSNPSAATLGGTTTVNAVNGVATFNNLKLDKAGTGYTLVASSDSMTSATSNAFNIACQTITVTPTGSPITTATVGSSYQQQFSQAGANGAVTWSLTPRSPSLITPPGLSLDSTGKLSGTPTQAGTYSFTVTATDGNSCPGTVDFTLTVSCPVVSLPSQPLADGTYGSPYSGTITPNGGTAPYTFTVSGLPTGMTRTPSVGNSGVNLVLGGTPAQTGNFTVQVTVTDAYECASGQQSYALKINKATPTITWNNPADITYGTALSVTQLNATANVVGNFSYNPASGTVLNAGNGQPLSVTFTPTDTNNYNSTSKQVQINVLKAPLSVTVNNAWRNQGAANPPFSGTITGLKNGDVITANYNTTATTSSPGGTYPITATLVDPGNRLGNYQVTNTPGTLTVLASCSAAINPPTLPPAALAQTYAAGLTVVALNSTVAGAYTFSHVAGTLPPGLSLVNTAGTFSLQGVPTTPGTFTFTLLAQRNAGGCSRAITYTLTIAPTVVPIAECIVNNGNGTFTARFGYDNSTGGVVTIPVGINNFFSVGAQNRNQPTVFQVGRVTNAFTVTFQTNGSDASSWLLKGPDNVLRSVLLTATSPPCP